MKLKQLSDKNTVLVINLYVQSVLININDPCLLCQPRVPAICASVPLQYDMAGLLTLVKEAENSEYSA